MGKHIYKDVQIITIFFVSFLLNCPTFAKDNHSEKGLHLRHVKSQSNPKKAYCQKNSKNLSFKERKKILEQRYEECKKKGFPLPSSYEKYKINELELISFSKEQTVLIAVFKNKVDKVVIYAKLGEIFWDGKVVGIQDNCVEIEEVKDLNVRKKIFIKKLCL